MARLPRTWIAPAPDEEGAEATELTMGSGGSHSYGTLADGDVLSGGIWDGWTVQIYDAGTDPLTLSDVAGGLQVVSESPTGTIYMVDSNYPLKMHGIYRDCVGDFDVSGQIAAGGTGDTYAGFGAAAWNIGDLKRVVAAGAAPPYTGSQYQPKSVVRCNGSGLEVTAGAVINFAGATYAFRLRRSGRSIEYWRGATLAALTQYYPIGALKEYDVVGSVCRVGFFFGGNVTATRVISEASLTYFPAP